VQWSDSVSEDQKLLESVGLRTARERVLPVPPGGGGGALGDGLRGALLLVHQGARRERPLHTRKPGK